MLTRILLATAASALLAGAAAAQTTGGATGSSIDTARTNSPIAGADTAPAPRQGEQRTGTDAALSGTVSGAADSSASGAVNAPATDTSGYNSRSSTDTGVSGGASTSADLGAAAPAPGAPSAGNAELVTNGPVPDTAANRAKYGQPDSRAGRHTRAAGN